MKVVIAGSYQWGAGYGGFGMQDGKYRWVIHKMSAKSKKLEPGWRLNCYVYDPLKIQVYSDE